MTCHRQATYKNFQGGRVEEKGIYTDRADGRHRDHHHSCRNRHPELPQDDRARQEVSSGIRLSRRWLPSLRPSRPTGASIPSHRRRGSRGSQLPRQSSTTNSQGRHGDWRASEHCDQVQRGRRRRSHRVHQGRHTDQHGQPVQCRARDDVMYVSSAMGRHWVLYAASMRPQHQLARTELMQRQQWSEAAAHPHRHSRRHS